MFSAPSGSGPGGCSASQARTSSRNRCSDGVRLRSTAGRAYRADGADCEHLAQRLAVELADAGQRDVGDDVHLAGRLGRRQTAARVRNQVVGGHGGAGTQADEGDHLLAEARVGPAHDTGHGHVGMGQQHVLDVAREDVEATAQDEVLLAIDDEEVPVGVEVSDVTGVQPATAQRVRRLVGSVPVAGHDPRAAHADLSVLADAEWLVGAVDDAHRAVLDGHTDAADAARARRS